MEMSAKPSTNRGAKPTQNPRSLRIARMLARDSLRDAHATCLIRHMQLACIANMLVTYAATGRNKQAQKHNAALEANAHILSSATGSFVVNHQPSSVLFPSAFFIFRTAAVPVRHQGSVLLGIVLGGEPSLSCREVAVFQPLLGLDSCVTQGDIPAAFLQRTHCAHFLSMKFLARL